MNVPRRGAAVAALEGKIYAFGGSRPYESCSDWEYEGRDSIQSRKLAQKLSPNVSRYLSLFELLFF